MCSLPFLLNDNATGKCRLILKLQHRSNYDTLSFLCTFCNYPAGHYPAAFFIKYRQHFIYPAFIRDAYCIIALPARPSFRKIYAQVGRLPVCRTNLYHCPSFIYHPAHDPGYFLFTGYSLAGRTHKFYYKRRSALAGGKV